MKSWGGGAGGGGGRELESPVRGPLACRISHVPVEAHVSQTHLGLSSRSLLSPSRPLALSPSLSLSLSFSLCVYIDHIYTDIFHLSTHTLIACFHGSKGRRAFATCVSPTMDDEPLLDLEDVYRCLGFNESRCPHRPSMMHTDPKGPST